MSSENLKYITIPIALLGVSFMMAIPFIIMHELNKRVDDFFNELGDGK